MGWNRGRKLGRRNNIDTSKKGVDNNSSGLEFKFRISAAGSVNRLTSLRGQMHIIRI